MAKTKPKPGMVFRGPDGHTATRTGDGVTAGDWFIFHHDRGGGYSDGVAQKVDDWVPMVEAPDG